MAEILGDLTIIRDVIIGNNLVVTGSATLANDTCTIDINGNVSIAGNVIDPSATLDLNSTTAGFLVPRLTTTQRNAIMSPATSLLIYNTTNSEFEYFNGASWTPLTGGGGGSSTLSGLTDVSISSPTNNELLIYNNSISKWENQDLLGQANGIATLDGSGHLTASQLGISTFNIKGNWDASTNTPTLANGTGTTGDFYIVSVAGTQDLGAGSVAYGIGDNVYYANSVWNHITVSTAVASVFGRLGAITAQSGDYNVSQITGAAASGVNTDITSISLDQTGLKIKDATSNYLTIKDNEALTANRTLNIVTGDVDRILTLAGNATVSGTNTGDQIAATVPNTPTGNISSTTVQDAINELDTEKVPTTTTVNGHALSSNVTVTKSDISLGNVTNDTQVKQSDYTAKGDVLAGTGSSIYSALPVGSDGQVLTADSTQTNGVKWSNSSGGVSSFNTRTGAVTSQSGDYTASQVGLGNVPNTDATNLANDTIQGTFTPSNTAIVTSDDGKTAFQKAQGQINAKEPTISSGTTSQYWRGDKTFQNLTTAVVSEVTNLYFTAARAIASALTGFTVSGTRTAIIATDTIIQAFGKAQKYFNDLATVAFSGSASDITTGTLPTGQLPTGISPANLTVANTDIIVGNASNVGVAVAVSGDINITNAGVVTIQSNVITNAKLSQSNANTWKGNNTGSTANVSDIAAANLTETGSSIFTISGTNAVLNAATVKANLNSGQIYVGNGSNVPVGVTASGDITNITNAGVVTVSSTSQLVTQTNTFTVGQVLTRDSGTYNLAQADTPAHAVVAGIVTAATGSTFTLCTNGKVTGLSGLSDGTPYFLSDVTPGLLTSTAPSTIGHVIVPVLLATSATTGIFTINPGSVIGYQAPIIDNTEITTSSTLPISGGLFVVNSASAITLTVPLLSTLTGGTEFRISNINSGAITIARSGSDLFSDGTTSFTGLQVQGNSVTLVPHNNGSNPRICIF